MEQLHPLFQEAALCDVCKCSFTTFRRRHRCRCCGRTLCSEHSSDQMTLPQFGINSPVGVCADCFNDSSHYGDRVTKPSINGADQITDSVAGLDTGPEADPSVEPVVQGNPKCKCGMPLCICEAPGPSTDSLPLQWKNDPVSFQPSTKPKKIDTVAKTRPSSSCNRNSSRSNSGQAAKGTLGKPKVDYDVNGEGLREAIKNDDTAAVKKLLSEGVDANYCDRQGMFLLHLAAVFNRTDICLCPDRPRCKLELQECSRSLHRLKCCFGHCINRFICFESAIFSLTGGNAAGLRASYLAV